LTTYHGLSEAQDIEWWPRHVRRAFANLGEVLGSARLHPNVLSRVSRDGLRGHEIIFEHEPEESDEEEMYILKITGPVYGGRWEFLPWFLELIVREAALSSVRLRN
jgi:hypothetical protein